MSNNLYLAAVIFLACLCSFGYGMILGYVCGEQSRLNEENEDQRST